ncbi:pyroglutamyl-peptidase 1 [Condylostylus longicornis]|uniref:pyroglutamyl-peptidase 1 n=1 Tax=Condylostylus longicornis TaxID=2530218 RepID=UPI00244D9D08|nr:pyroglutamyl-peptidase 1 [Condylostylus longicornis]
MSTITESFEPVSKRSCEGVAIKVDKEKNNERLIVVTGFGPFAGHELMNASWEAVRILPETLISKNQNHYKVEKIFIAVTYDDVDKNIENIWKRNPDLVIHCGVNGEAKTLHIENTAHNKKFDRVDYSCKLLPGSTASLANNGIDCKKLETKLNARRISERINKNQECLKQNPVLVSNDCGNYLCGYIYLKSLDVDCRRTLFIHVPPINKPFTSEETSFVLWSIVRECIEQIESNALDYNENEERLQEFKNK